MQRKVELTEMYEQKRIDVAKYQNNMQNEIMKLNNDI